MTCACLTECLYYHLVDKCTHSRSLLQLTCPPPPLPGSAWLTGYDDPMIDVINQRIEDLTGLEMDTAEELQVKILPNLDYIFQTCLINITHK